MSNACIQLHTLHAMLQSSMRTSQSGHKAHLQVDDALVVGQGARGHEGEEVVGKGVRAAAHHLEQGLGSAQFPGDPAREARWPCLPLLALALACITILNFP